VKSVVKKTSAHAMAPAPETDPEQGDATGLPGIRRWRSVYLIVAGIFVTWVVLLTVLTKLYS
jgi:hypothetical protein